MSPVLVAARRLGALAAATAALVAVVPAATAVAAPKPGVITGVVTGDGRALRNVTVEAVTPVTFGGGTVLEVEASTTTAADGSYRLTGVPDFAVRVQFVADRAVGGTSPTGYADRCFGGQGSCTSSGREISVGPGVTRSGVDAALTRAGVIQGRLVDSLGRGVGGMTVLLDGDSEPDGQQPTSTTTSDVNGNYVFPQQYAGQHFVCVGSPYEQLKGTPNRDGYVYDCGFTVTVGVGKIRRVTTTLVGGGGIAGRVVDSTGKPVAGADVYSAIPNAGGFDEPSATTAADGSFRLGHLRPVTQQLCVDAPRFESTCGSGLTVRVKELATAQAGRIVLQRVS